MSLNKKATTGSKVVAEMRVAWPGQGMEHRGSSQSTTRCTSASPKVWAWCIQLSVP